MNLPFARTFLHRDSTASTNDDARVLASDPAIALPLVVVADRQTAGRGRGSNAWWSSDGSLLFTIALDPDSAGLRPDHAPRLALATAVGLIDALDGVVPDGLLGLRWPNDVEAGGRKLAGILPESFSSAIGPRLLVGIGLNVSNRFDHAPAEVRSLATSVEILRGGGAPRPIDLLGPILERFSEVVSRLSADDPGLADRWAALDTLSGEAVRVDLGSRVVSGIGAGIDDRGGLRIATGSGIETLFGGRVLRDRHPT